jgi:deoxyribose-phosphate aldolase
MERLAEILNRAQAFTDETAPSSPEPDIPQGNALAAYIDHTLLKPEATAGQVRRLCEEALAYHFASVCINPVNVPLASAVLKGAIPVCSVIGFPLGATLCEVKVAETDACLRAGASEIDMVMNIGALKGGEHAVVLDEVSAIAREVHAAGAILKVILENALLTRQEKVLACLLSQAAGADFVKTSTGFGPGGATVEDVALMRRVVGLEMGIKAAGGIRSLGDAQAMIRAGATRLGASAGVKIMQEALMGNGPERE